MNASHALRLGAAAAALALLASCGESDPSPFVDKVTARICPGPDAQKQALIAFFDAHEGDVIEFCEGQFDFTTGLVMMGKKGITIRGAGKDKTYLRFKDSADQDGFNLNRMTGITVEGLTIYDAPGNGLRIFRSDFVTVRDVKVGWSVSDPASPYGNYEPPDATGTPPDSWTANGAYAFYPVISHHVLIEDSISVGSSDAGVYVGQSSDILVRRTEAYHNVAGFEFENTYRAEFVDNYAHDNVGGFLIFDLPGRVQYGEKNLVHDNKSYHNNLANFAPRGAIVGYVPAGVGVLVLASDQLELYANDIRDNRTVGIVLVNYGLVDPLLSQRRYDFFSEGIHIYENLLTDNGGNPQAPDPDRAPCTGPGGLPMPTDPPDCQTENPGLLVSIIQAKNGGKSAHIVWDGGVDSPGYPERVGASEAYCDSVPVDRDGVPLTQANAGETDDERYEARSDERGRPNLYQFDPEPACPYKAWKFDDAGALKKPQNGLCIENNTFVNGPANGAVDDYVNVNFSTADPSDPQNQLPADHTLPSDCPTVAAPLLAQFTPVLGSFTPHPEDDPRPSQAERDAVCGGGSPGKVNLAAVLQYNCPRLDHYGLFEDAQDPTKDPVAPGVPFDLNTALFSDYAVKYRFLFLPTDAGGAPQKATYMDSQDCDTINIYDCYTATLGYPVGTVFAKTFAFRDGDSENVVETRLLIKRENADGLPYWTGFAYEWVGAGAERHAELKLEGATHAVSWDYDDPDPDARDANGERPHYAGSTAGYAVPHAGACLLCHGGDDREAGAAPIGPKVRNLNKDYDYGGGVGVVNQIQRLVDLNLLDAPAEVEAPMPKWNVPGTGHASDAPTDTHKRARAWLEVNCMHCHNPAGAAQNSGLRLDAFTEPIDVGHGICKPPIAAGKAADNGDYDIEPANSGRSILHQRVASVEPGIKMPPLARSVPQAEVIDLLGGWIDDVVYGFANETDRRCAATATGSGPLPAFMVPVAPTAAQKAPWG